MNRTFRTSQRIRRSGVALLASMLLGHLLALTYWRFSELTTLRVLAVFAVLWAAGAVALALLVRAWRKS